MKVLAKSSVNDIKAMMYLVDFLISSAIVWVDAKSLSYIRCMCLCWYLPCPTYSAPPQTFDFCTKVHLKRDYMAAEWSLDV